MQNFAKYWKNVGKSELSEHERPKEIKYMALTWALEVAEPLSAASLSNPEEAEGVGFTFWAMFQNFYIREREKLLLIWRL